MECCRQHDRAAKLHRNGVGDGDEPELENMHADALCAMCDGSLAEMAEAYTKAAGDVHPERDEAWWHKANSLWHASREYARRHAGCDQLSKQLSGKHSSEQLRAMQLEYELEASALLALRHAAEAYRKTRPELATPDVQMHLVPYSIKDPKTRKLQDFPSMTIACYQLRPESLGSIHIRSADPKAQPAIRFNFLAESIDRECLLSTMRITRRLASID